MGRGSLTVLAGIVVLSVAVGCGGGGTEPDAPRGAAPPQVDRKPSRDSHADDAVRTVAPSHCPAGVPDCRTTEGRIVYVERVDPDGDGDAHFVIADPQGITLRGLTAIDVRRGLRPRPLPETGDLLSAAGPVQTGSYGQSQIHALELHVGR